MAKVVFYEKSGCGGNALQKALLEASGHDVEARDLLSEPRTPESLRPFFGTRPVRAWFNLSAPRVKSGEIDPDMIGEEKALALMVEDPLLIRRPLLQVGARREVGFEPAQVDIWIGLAKARVPVGETCLKTLASS